MLSHNLGAPKSRRSTLRRAFSATCAALALLSPAGCTGTLLDPIPAALAPGEYWVEARADELAAFALPRARGAAGEWTTAGPRDEWFVGDGVYLFTPEDGWRKIAVDDALSLDGVLQTYDVRP